MIDPLPELDRTASTFKTDCDTFFGTQLPVFSTQVEAARVEILAAQAATADDAADAAADAAQTAADRVATGLDRTQTGQDVVVANAAAAAAAAYAASLSGTSASSLLIAVASKTFAATTGRQWGVGQFLVAASAANPANFMHGQVTSYNAGTGALVLNVLDVGGSGTYADWVITLSAPKGVTGATGPSGLTAWIRKTGAYTAAVNERIGASTAGGAWSLTFPPSPADGDEVEVRDVDGTFHVNRLTLLCNSSKNIMGYTTSWVLDTRYFHGRFVYDATTNNWGV